MERQIWKHSPRLKVQSCDNGLDLDLEKSMDMTPVHVSEKQIGGQGSRMPRLKYQPLPKNLILDNTEESKVMHNV